MATTGPGGLLALLMVSLLIAPTLGGSSCFESEPSKTAFVSLSKTCLTKPCSVCLTEYTNFPGGESKFFDCAREFAGTVDAIGIPSIAGKITNCFQEQKALSSSVSTTPTPAQKPNPVPTPSPTPSPSPAHPSPEAVASTLSEVPQKIEGSPMPQLSPTPTIESPATAIARLAQSQTPAAHHNRDIAQSNVDTVEKYDKELKKFDVNGDGKLDAVEFAAAKTALFQSSEKEEPKPSVPARGSWFRGSSLSALSELKGQVQEDAAQQALIAMSDQEKETIVLLYSMLKTAKSRL